MKAGLTQGLQMRRRFAAIAIAMSMVSALSLTAFSAAEAESAGGFRISVSDILDGSPITDARVFLIGWNAGTSRAWMTDANGTAHAESLNAGTYRLIVEHAQFQDARQDIWVNAGAVTVITVRMARVLKVLARITAVQHSEVSSSVFHLNQQSAERKLSENLISAINMLAGANVSLGNDGQPAGISIRGHDPSATSYNIGGMHVGGSVALQGVDPDLLASAEVDLNREQVNLLLSGPTHDPTYTFDGLVGGFESTKLKSMAQATSGSVGFVLSLVSRGADSALNGATYLDASGLTYGHIGTLRSTASLLKTVFPVGESWHASVDYLTSNTALQRIPDVFAGLVPEGIGPNNYQLKRGGTVDFSLDGALGVWLVSASAGEIYWNDVENNLHRVVGGQSLPNYGTTRGRAISTSVNFSRIFSLDHSLSVELMQTSNLWTDTSYDPSFGDLPGSTAADHMLRTVDLQDTRLNHNHATSLVSDFKLSSVENAAWRPSIDETLSWQHGSGTWKFDASFGAVPTFGIAPQTLQDAAFATYDCSHQMVLAQAPGATRNAEMTSGARLEYAQKITRGSISATVYDEIDNGVLLSDAIVAAPFEPTALVGPSYVPSLIAGYSTYGGCTGPTPSVNSIYFRQPIGGLTVVYRGLDLAARINLSQHVSISGSYAFSGAILRTRDRRLESPNSPFIFNHQLPNVPLQKWSFTEDWAWQDARTEMLANESLLSSNNEQNLPSYALVTIGLERHLSAVSTLTIVASNAMSTDVGLFISPSRAVPLRTVSGVALPTLATPLTQPRLTANLNIQVGRP